MARLNCPNCPKTFKGEGGLSWHKERSHPASSAAEGTAVTALVGQQQPVVASAGPEDPEWWPSVDDLFEEDEPLALHDLLNRGFPRLAERVEALSRSFDQALSEREADRLKVRDSEPKVAALEELTMTLAKRLGEQVTRGDRLERRAEAAERQLGLLAELVRPLMVLALHTDGHQRGEKMNVTSLVEAFTSPPRWTLWRREEVYEEARQKLLAFLGGVREQHEPLLRAKAVVPARLASQRAPALSQSFLDTILHTALGTATSIAVARVLSASVVPGGVQTNPQHGPSRTEEEEEKKKATSSVLSPGYVEGDQEHLDADFLRALMEDLDRILRDPDKMGIVDGDTLRIIRE